MNIVARTTLPGGLKLFAMDDLAEAAIFILAIFIGLNKEKILKTKSYIIDIKTRVASLFALVLGLFLYFSYKNFLLNNLVTTSAHLYLFTLTEYLILFAVLFALINMIFGSVFIIDSFKKYGKNLPYFLSGVFLIYLAQREFQKLWGHLSTIVGHSVVYLLGLFGTATMYYANKLPILTFNGFSVGIAQTCSGIDSILLFTGLYLGILAWDWKTLNKKKMFLMYFIGAIGVFSLGIIRIFLLILFGTYISKEFALHTFHTNASSLLFIVYFSLFWGLGYKWMKTKKKKNNFK